MKRKVLLAGKNQSIMDDFFYVLSNDFECMTTSVRSFDIANHIKYFQPDVFVYCMTVETKETVMTIANALNEVGRRKQKLVLIGETEACNEFMRWKAEMVSLVLEKPINANIISEKIANLLEEFSKISTGELETSVEKLETSVEELEKSTEETEELKKPVSVKSEIKEKVDDNRRVPSSNGNKQILVIDDDIMMLKLIKEELRDDYNVATAVSGKIGMIFIERKQVDLILLDYEMPGESGPEVLAKLRENEKTKDIPVVFLTGINDKEKIENVLSMKPQGYLLKPIDHDKLIQTISKVIG